MKMDENRAHDLWRRAVHQTVCAQLIGSLRANVSCAIHHQRQFIHSDVRLMTIWPVKAIVQGPAMEGFRRA